MQLLTLSANGHDVARGDGKEVVGVVHLIGLIDGDYLETSAADVLNEGLILLPQRVLLGAGLASPDVARAVFRIAGIGLQTAANHRTQVAIDDVEVGVEVHLHLPELMVANHNYGVVAEGIGLKHLSDTLVVGTHTAADERHVACRQIVSALKSAVALDAEDGLESEVVVAKFDDVSLGCALRGVHAADDVTAGRGDALVAREI